MRKKILHSLAVIALAILVAILVWQGSFSFGPGQATAGQTYLFWAVSTLVFILTVTLGFMLFRTAVRLWVERQENKEGSRIRTKLVVGALALSIMPVFFLMVFGIQVLNFNMNRWFLGPTESVLTNLTSVSASFERQTELRAAAQAQWLARDPLVVSVLETGRPSAELGPVCAEHEIHDAWLERDDGPSRLLCASPPGKEAQPKLKTARVSVPGGRIMVRSRVPVDLAAKQEAVDRDLREYHKLSSYRKEFRQFYIMLLLLISLFILFVATWIALQLAKQISTPISALVEAAGRLREGHLEHRIQTKAIDEIGTLVRAFNQMAADIETKEQELERRRAFTEAILESIPTGVISLSADRRIQRVNGALAQIFGADRARNAGRIEDLFGGEDAREVHYLLNRARRVGVASAQLDLMQGRQTLHLSVTVSALAGSSGWVVVLEDTSELLQAQKSAAWHEVARRIAHEIKNPLTPIALSAERIARQLERAGPSAATGPDVVRILRECSLTISGEVQSLKSLVDEFSQFARFPAAQPVASDLNEVVDSALSVFAGRLDGVEVRKHLAPELPPVAVDREQFKRVIVNLVDNAAEAMRESLHRTLLVSTQLAGPDAVELIVADTGHGILPEDRERLFLPYFSTKERGTGLGLAIVHRIVSEHQARIRVEDNAPCGARFVIEIPIPQAVEGPGKAAEAAA